MRWVTLALQRGCPLMPSQGYRVKAMGEGAYRFAIRPAAVAHGHPVLVFDRHDRLHLPLTQFAKEAHRRVSMSTALAYVRSLLPFFTELDTRGGGDGPRWNRPPAEVRPAVDDYLVRRAALPRPCASSRIPARRPHRRHAEHGPRVLVGAQALLSHDADHGGVRLPQSVGRAGDGYGGAGRRGPRRRRPLAPDARRQRRRRATPNAAPVGQLLQARRRRLASADRG